MPLTQFEEAEPPVGDGDPIIDRMTCLKCQLKMSDVITRLVKCSLEADGFI